MTNFRLAARFTVFGFLLASLGGSLRAAPDQTLGMALMSATVDAGGKLVRGAGVIDTDRLATGEYQVYFNRSLKDCTCTSSTGYSSTGSWARGQGASANCPYSSDNSVLVYTWITADGGGALINVPFHLLVFCPR